MLTAGFVIVQMGTSDADIAFLALVMKEEDNLGKALYIDSLIALSTLRLYRRLNRQELARFIQKSEDGAGRVLEALVELGLIQSHGGGSVRSYTMSQSPHLQNPWAACRIYPSGGI